jgi:hypothetical protein
MSPGQIIEWLAYQKVRGPLGPQRMDVYMASLMSVIAASVGAKTKPSDFLPNWRPAPEVDPMDVFARFEAGEFGEVPE